MIRAILTSGSMRSLRSKPDRSCATKPGHSSCHRQFARDLMVQEVGHAMLKERGITLVAADSPDAFLDDTPTAVLIRQVLGAVSQFEKAMLVSNLKGARDRKAKALGL